MSYPAHHEKYGDVIVIKDDSRFHDTPTPYVFIRYTDKNGFPYYPKSVRKSEIEPVTHEVTIPETIAESNPPISELVMRVAQSRFYGDVIIIAEGEFEPMRIDSELKVLVFDEYAQEYDVEYEAKDNLVLTNKKFTKTES